VGFNLDDYEPVAARLDRWLAEKLAGYNASTNDYPRVLTRMVSEPGADICVIRAELWLGENLIATGYAEEIRDVSGKRTVNSSSHVENCETSAIGRALANCGMAGSDMTKRPSREEMSKVQRTSNGPTERGTDDRMPSVTITQPAGLASEKQVYYAASFYKKADREAPKKWLATLNKAEMSALIDDLKAGKFPEPDPNEEAPF
jgi:hypothetical protein